MDAARLRRTQTWIFDLDETLYPPDAGLLAAVDARITAFIARELGVGRKDAERIRRETWESHGITLGGLVERHGVAPARFLEEVHAIDLSHVRPDARLARALAALPGRRIVHTNAARAHAERVLAALGIGQAFDAVFAIEDKALEPKPRKGAYARVIAATGLDPRRAVMIEDTARNLVEPARLGMGTVWLAPGGGPVPAHVDLSVPCLPTFLETVPGDGFHGAGRAGI